MLSNVRVIPSGGNRIRAAAAANPKAPPLEPARELGMEVAEVELALGRGNTRQIKSVVPRA